jgi:hypothetical protein
MKESGGPSLPLGVNPFEAQGKQAAALPKWLDGSKEEVPGDVDGGVDQGGGED